MEDRWLAWAKRLQAIASTGLHFGASEYDKERFAEVGDIADAMLAALGNVPLSRIRDLVPDFAQGYATPRIDVRGAVLRGSEVLLVRERTDGLWALPGGYADLGLSAAENVVKEIHEEAGMVVEARSLYGVRHKAKHEYNADARDFYKFFFLCEERCEQIDPQEPRPGVETSAARFFPLSDLPPLSTGRVIAKDIHDAFAFLNNAGGEAFFD
jgi:ADP-ribose pyrophosphatase YjhB (NUDIX family)